LNQIAAQQARVFRGVQFYELAEGSPVAADVLRRIASLYAIED